ncbi:probable RNA-binding protein ARP1 isoform X2 [Typha angustifolia]|uniref:probable RNA-binding protein ARP1 isoform X2 n=1 Tax=Typha angustifolia TaxID=59011 RepID=UPI003C2F33ED
MGQQLGDTSLTKVFVGGLAWETQREALRDHFETYGEILEAVIISDKLTGRSKGYGFVTFKDADAARKACDDPTPVINGRRANCNLASLGAKARPRYSPQNGPAVGSRAVTSGGPPAPAPWYYHPTGTPPSPVPLRHHYPGVVPFYPAAYGYSPSYVTDLGYNAKVSLSHSAGGGQFSYPGQGGMVAPNAMLPVYPFYHYQHRHSHGMGIPAHFFPPTTATIPTVVSKPTAVPPAAVCVAVEPVTGCS